MHPPINISFSYFLATFVNIASSFITSIFSLVSGSVTVLADSNKFVILDMHGTGMTHRYTRLVFIKALKQPRKGIQIITMSYLSCMQ